MAGFHPFQPSLTSMYGGSMSFPIYIYPLVAVFPLVLHGYLSVGRLLLEPG